MRMLHSGRVQRQRPLRGELIGRCLSWILGTGCPDSRIRVVSPSTGTGDRDAVLVIDASGSMLDTDWKPCRLDAAKQAASQYTLRLASDEPDASVAVVRYGESADVMCGLTPVSNRASIEKAVQAISICGSTNLTAGLKEALRILRNSHRSCQVVALTDGHHNAGRGPKSVADSLRKIATLECVGIGGCPSDVDEDLLKAIASPHPDGSPRYRWIGDKERLVEHFHNLAGRLARS